MSRGCGAVQFPASPGGTNAGALMSDALAQPTPVSLLTKMRGPSSRSTEEAWRRFVRLYTPLLLLWARRVGAIGADAEDLVGDVFVVLSREMPGFRHDPQRRFRGWLWTVLRNRWSDRVRQRSAQPTC